MISRFLSDVVPVHALDQVSFHSCTVTGFVCSCGVGSTGGALPYSHGGRIIDRLGLSRRFAAVKIAVAGYGDIQCSAGSTAMTNYIGVAAGLMHSATTCAADFADYSAGDWPSEQAFQVVTTATSTSSPFYSAQGALLSANAAGALTTGLTTSTSTGYAALVDISSNAIPLTAAKRFIRVNILPHIETTGCGGSNAKMSAALIFGFPEEAPTDAPLGRVFVTSACST